MIKFWSKHSIVHNSLWHTTKKTAFCCLGTRPLFLRALFFEKNQIFSLWAQRNDDELCVKKTDFLKVSRMFQSKNLNGRKMQILKKILFQFSMVNQLLQQRARNNLHDKLANSEIWQHDSDILDTKKNNDAFLCCCPRPFVCPKGKFLPLPD